MHWCICKRDKIENAWGKLRLIKNHFKSCLLILFFYLFVPATALAEEKISVVKVGVFQLAPLVYIDDNGSPQGVFVDLIEAMGRRENWKIEYVKGTWEEGLERVKTGRIDLMTGVMHLPRREPFLDFPHESIFNIWGQIYTRTDTRISGVFDMEGKTIGVLKGGANGENFLELLGKLGIQGQLIAFDSQEDIARAIKEKRADAGVFTNIHGYKYQQSHQLKQTQIVFDPSYLKYATAKGMHPQLLSTIDRYLVKWKSDGTSPYHEIIEKHLGLPKKEAVPDWVWTIAFIGAGIIGLALFIVFLLMVFNKKLKNEVKASTEKLVAELDRRKNTEKELKENEERFRGIVDSMADWIWEVDAGGRYTYCSEKVENLLGYPPDEMLGKRPFDFMPPDEAEEIGRVFSNIVAQKTTIKDLENWKICRDGRSVCMLINGVPILNENGDLLGFRGVDKDITEHKQAEAERMRLEAQIHQSRKMESIGTLAGGIAHDFNNILFPIIGYTEMLMEDIPEHTPFRNSLNEIYAGALRARDLVQQILAFSRQGKSELTQTRIQPIIEEALKLIRSTIPTTISIRQDLQSDCGEIKADPTQIHQIVMNLATNAYHAMEEAGGELTVSLKKIRLGRYNRACPDIPPGEYACLTVADTGVGMEKQLTEKIFEPFFTTKKTGKGTGMGLSVVHGIVKKMKGEITVYSEPGRGSEFQVYLPMVKQAVEIQAPRMEKTLQGGTERVLLVDDEESIISMEKQILERLGYRVTPFAGSLEALEAFKAAPEGFDLVITDMAMPKMSGDKLAAELIKIRPGIPILICTGFNEAMTEDKIKSLGIKGLLLKPMMMKDLDLKIREILDAPKKEGP